MFTEKKIFFSVAPQKGQYNPSSLMEALSEHVSFQKFRMWDRNSWELLLEPSLLIAAEHGTSAAQFVWSTT